MTLSDIARFADEELMQLVQEGEPRAFELVYERHGGPAFSLAYRMVGSRAAAEDITQEAFLSIWRSRHRYRRCPPSSRASSSLRTRRLHPQRDRRDARDARRDSQGRMRLGLDKLRRGLSRDVA